MSESIFNPQKRLTRAQRNANDKKWFKDQLGSLDKISFARGSLFGQNATSTGMNEYRTMKINYDLFNGIINTTDFEKVCYPFGREAGDMPADFTNKDIISGKVKALLGMEMKRPFSWKVVAVNPEATSRKEQAEMGYIKEYVTNSIIAPIREELEMKYAQEQQGKQLTPEEQDRIQQQVSQELQAMTPPEVKKYMEREHQDPAEAMAHQILEYLIQEQDIKMKFNKGWKHALISGREVFWTGIVNGKPALKLVNPMRFDYDRAAEADYIEEGEWACYEMVMTPSDIVKNFGSELTPLELDEIYEEYNHAATVPDSSFTFRDDGSQNMLGIRVIHGEWKALKAMKFLTYMDSETGEIFEEIVDESYKINREAGDISVETLYIPALFEGYMIGRDKYAFLREVPGQYKDLDNLYNCKLSYKGAALDALNSVSVSLVDRMKYYQYMYNIINYRIELLMASDDGKSILLNANLIPKSAGLDIEKWMYYWKVNKVGILDPSEEGNKGNTNIGEAAKEIDMSLVSDIQKYIQLAEYIERRCGESVGITKQIEGQIGANEAVRNTQQALVSSANILEPYFEVHNNVKRNVLQALLESAKVAYSEFQPASLAYTLDDMSMKMLQPDYDLLDNSTYGIFVSDSMKSHEALEMVQQLSHAALQNQRVELSDVIQIMRSESIQEAEELLKTAERERQAQEQQAQEQQLQAQADSEEKARQFLREEHAMKMEFMERQEELKTEREIQKQTILSLGFNEDKDLDKDGVPDVLEVAKFGVDASIKQSKIDLERDKLEHTKKQDAEKNKLEREKIAANKAKSNQIKSKQ